MFGMRFLRCPSCRPGCRDDRQVRRRFIFRLAYAAHRGTGHTATDKWSRLTPTSPGRSGNPISQPAGDLLRRVLRLQILLDQLPQHQIRRQLRRLGPAFSRVPRPPGRAHWWPDTARAPGRNGARRGKSSTDYAPDEGQSRAPTPQPREPQPSPPARRNSSSGPPSCVPAAAAPPPPLAITQRRVPCFAIRPGPQRRHR